MAIKPVRALAAALLTVLLASTAGAQNLSQSSISSNKQDTPVGATIGQDVQQFAEGVPELQQVDRARDLRDTSNRGSFVGADSSDATFFGSDSQGGGNTGASRRTQRTTSRGGSFRQSNAQTQTGRSRGTTLRPRLALGFQYSPKLAPRFVENARAYLDRIPSLSHNPSIRVCVEKNVVVLEGTVASAHDRILSAQLIALAPGVYAIDNRLKVAGADSPSP